MTGDDQLPFNKKLKARCSKDAGKERLNAEKKTYALLGSFNVSRKDLGPGRRTRLLGDCWLGGGGFKGGRCVGWLMGRLGARNLWRLEVVGGGGFFL